MRPLQNLQFNSYLVDLVEPSDANDVVQAVMHKAGSAVMAELLQVIDHRLTVLQTVSLDALGFLRHLFH